MKRFVAVVLIITFLPLATVCYAEKSNVQIEVNGVKIILTDGDRVLHAIEEDGVVYVPIGAFLDAINIPYEQNGEKIIINITNQAVVESGSSEKQETTDYFAQLPEDEQTMIGGLIVWANKNTTPSSLRIKKAYLNESHHRYLLYISYDNLFNRTLESRIYVSFGNAFIAPEQYEDDDLKALDTDIEILNNAYQQKCEDKAFRDNVIDSKGQEEIDKQVSKVKSAEEQLQRWIDGGKKTEADIQKQRDKVQKEKDKLEELRKKYGIFD